MKLTHEDIHDISQKLRFKDKFPDGLELTLENLFNNYEDLPNIQYIEQKLVKSNSIDMESLTKKIKIIIDSYNTITTNAKIEKDNQIKMIEKHFLEKCQSEGHTFNISYIKALMENFNER